VTGGEVVVGVDGSRGSRAALLAAARSAARRGGRLRVVLAYQPPEWMRARGVGPAEVVPSPGRPDPERLAFETAREMTSEVIDQVYAETGTSIPVDVDAVAGRPVDVLVDVARGAAELVVDSRGRGAAASALLGSVALDCVRHARCPVTVVPDGPRQSR
jgi:nucleotide-binding universal stress UspA family protein